jgi:tight adherence protein C
VDRAVAQRRARVRAEVPALCHLLALRLRARGSAVGAVADTIARSRGLLVDELAEALAQHRAGRPLDEALDAAALVTPSPDAARVHRLLAGTVRHGVDAVPELLRLSREVRQAHLLQLRREATGRRAAVLVPIVGLLAPLILLFLAAPIPGLLAGG